MWCGWCGVVCVVWLDVVLGVWRRKKREERVLLRCMT